MQGQINHCAGCTRGGDPLHQGPPNQLQNFYQAVSTFDVTATKKGRQLFWWKKCTSRENPGYVCEKRGPP